MMEFLIVKCFFKSRSYGSLGITSVLILAFLIGFLAFKARNDQWNIWKLNENITFYNGSPLFTTLMLRILLERRK